MKHLFRSDRRSFVDRALPKSNTPELPERTHLLKLLAFGLAVLTTGFTLHSRDTEAQTLPWMNTALPPEQRSET